MTASPAAVDREIVNRFDVRRSSGLPLRTAETSWVPGLTIKSAMQTVAAFALMGNRTLERTAGWP